MPTSKTTSTSSQSAPQTKVPRYLRHKTRNRAYVYLRTPDGGRRQVYLPGPFDSPESHRAYREIVARYLLDPVRRQVTGSIAPTSEPMAIVVEEVVARFLVHAESYYVKDGKCTGEVTSFRCAARPLLRLYRDEPAAEFSPRKLELVREIMVENGWSRPYVNAQIRRIKQVFKWGASQELVPPTVVQALACVVGLRRGRCTAREPDKILPVEWSVVKETLPRLPPMIAAMVLVAWHTGMRPAEVCIMRGCDVDRSRDVWTYTPASHKTQHHDRSRTIAIGPKAQVVLAPFLLAAGDGFVFAPARGEAERHAEMRRARKSKVQPSQVTRNEQRVSNPKRDFAPHYKTNALNRALRRAQNAAGIERWSFNQLRHACATRLRQEFGSIEAARVVLGHSSADVTTIYAERDFGLAVEAMRKLG